MHGSLGDPIHVGNDRPVVAEYLEPRSEGLDLQGLAAEDDGTQRECRGRGPAPRSDRHGEVAEGGWGLGQHCDAFGPQQRVEFAGDACHPLGDDDQAAAVQQRAPHLEHREVESVAMEHGPHVGCAEPVQRLRARHEPDDIAVRDHDALGLAGRS